MFTVNDCRVFTCRLPVDFACEQNIYHIGYRQSTVQRFLCIIFNKLTPLPSYLRFFFFILLLLLLLLQTLENNQIWKAVGSWSRQRMYPHMPRMGVVYSACGVRPSVDATFSWSPVAQLPSCQSSGCLVAQLPSCHCIFLGKFQWQDNYFRLRIAAR